MNDLDRYAVSLENMEVLRAKVEALEAWKAEELALMNPLMDYARSICTGPLGCSITEWLVEDHKAQAREIERLMRDSNRWQGLAKHAATELAALKAQPSGVVLPPHCTDRAIPVKYRKGWNCCISEVARLNSSPVSSAPSHGEQVREWNLSAYVLPACGKPVLAYYLNSHGKGRRIRAEYVKAWTVQADDLSDPDTECVEYSEQEDAYYIRHGWYELIDNWEEYGRIAVHEGVITHWQELPAAPSAGSQGGDV